MTSSSPARRRWFRHRWVGVSPRSRSSNGAALPALRSEVRCQRGLGTGCPARAVGSAAAGLGGVSEVEPERWDEVHEIGQQPNSLGVVAPTEQSLQEVERPAIAERSAVDLPGCVRVPPVREREQLSQLVHPFGEETGGEQNQQKSCPVEELGKVDPVASHVEQNTKRC